MNKSNALQSIKDIKKYVKESNYLRSTRQRKELDVYLTNVEELLKTTDHRVELSEEIVKAEIKMQKTKARLDPRIDEMVNYLTDEYIGRYLQMDVMELVEQSPRYSNIVDYINLPALAQFINKANSIMGHVESGPMLVPRFLLRDLRIIICRMMYQDPKVQLAVKREMASAGVGLVMEVVINRAKRFEIPANITKYHDRLDNYITFVFEQARIMPSKLFQECVLKSKFKSRHDMPVDAAQSLHLQMMDMATNQYSFVKLERNMREAMENYRPQGNADASHTS